MSSTKRRPFCLGLNVLNCGLNWPYSSKTTYPTAAHLCHQLLVFLSCQAVLRAVTMMNCHWMDWPWQLKSAVKSCKILWDFASHFDPCYLFYKGDAESLGSIQICLTLSSAMWLLMERWTCAGSVMIHSYQFPDNIFRGIFLNENMSISIKITGVYTEFSGRLSEEPFPWLMQKFPCILIFKTGQPGCQLEIRLDLTSGRPLV